MSATLDEALLAEVAAGDPQRAAALRARIAAGEPAPYVLGVLRFRGHRFRIDPRAYITDPEASHLVDTVLAEGRALQAQLGRPLQVLEFGIGAATQGLSVLLEQPDWRMAGLDIDADALALAAENARLHGQDLELFASDYLTGWPAGRAPPDLLFADPPWGSREDLYDAERNADYYDRMPPASAYPQGGRTAIHDALIRHLVARRWPSLLVLNYGVLPAELIARSAAPLPQWALRHPQPGMSVLVGRAA
jgi:methylase of polypeptide subunit release factors